MTWSFKQVYQDLRDHGEEISPRGSRTLEIQNYTYTLEPYDRFAAFPSRKLSLPYIQQELRWYFKGDPWDLSICQHAKIWEQCVTDGVIHSNYGYYLFRKNGLEYAVNCLKRDLDSRRAVVTILGSQHLFLENNDVPCTVSMGFRVRDKKLLCTVDMRSQDAVYGMGNDIPFFSIVQELVAASLSLPMGPLTVFVESFHAYERHWGMLENLLQEQQESITIPRISGPARSEEHTSELQSH